MCAVVTVENLGLFLETTWCSDCQAGCPVYLSNQPHATGNVAFQLWPMFHDWFLFLEFFSKDGASLLSDEEILSLVNSRHIAAYQLESVLGDHIRAVNIRYVASDTFHWSLIRLLCRFPEVRTTHVVRIFLQTNSVSRSVILHCYFFLSVSMDFDTV